MPTSSDKHGGFSPPPVSVVICAFNPERFEVLGDAIESVRGQTLPAHEILLVIDHAPELLAKIHARWPDTRAIPNSETQGLSGARNTGLAEASGEVIAFLDDDAVASPEWLERMAARYADARVLGVGGAIVPRWLEGRPRWFPPEFDWVVGCTHSGMPHEPRPVRNLVGANMSFRRRVLEQIGGFRHELTRVGKNPVGGDETDVCIRIRQRWPEGTILYDPAVAVDHVVPPARSRFSYFTARCAAEGRSKAVLSLLVGKESGLETERVYTRRTLPAGFVRGVRDLLRGDPAGAARAGTIAIGLLTTAAGYGRGRGLLRRQRARSPSPVPVSPTQPLRILMVTPRNPLGQGGVERHVMEVGRRMAASGARVDVLCAEPGGAALREQRRDGLVIRSVRAWPAKRDLYLAPRIWREMARRPWDVVHVQSYHTLVAPLAMLRALTLGIPYVVTFHGGGHSSQLRNRLRRAQRLALRPLLARAERLVAVARFEIDLYARELEIPAERFVLIPNGTDLPVGGTLGGKAPRNGHFASIGRLERYKGHDRVIAALPHVLARKPQARLLVVGTGPYEASLRRQAAALGVEESVEFTSVPAADRSGMTDLLQGVSLVVLLSDFETHPLVALEAAAAGRPLLVADRGGLAELADEGVARAISPDDAPGAIGAAILEELEHPQERRAPSLSSWDDCATSLLELYRSLV